MNRHLITLLLFFTPLLAFSQETERVLLRGTVLYQNSPVQGENVINATTERATITNQNGEFEIWVSPGDVLAFTALNYQFKTLLITPEILTNARVVVEVDEKITELDEIVVSPSNREKFLELKEEEFKETAYEIDPSTPVENVALPLQDRGMKYGLNFVNIFKALFQSAPNTDGDPANNLMPSDVLRQVYDDRFFVVDLDIPQDRISEFLFYIDDRFPSRQLLKKDQEFQLIDFLVEESKNFNELIKDQK
ncbi:carboxypeptidase-like regulatory domain-containing protein [Robertkochia aurantiaca]|uniref:carboxypeptidase-like regulatory domain-containing protein n=1 Tax=Robertkochia aurantiaca TaxID=2873700 RepID=UPI001CD0163D|nr:carboxypeptidase-like regulatory domain-containing protein [Robertkochia sp. 3YJGBD-33]